jgi:serine phosphatase RsbU (regulator of sigma subunit)
MGAVTMDDAIVAHRPLRPAAPVVESRAPRTRRPLTARQVATLVVVLGLLITVAASGIARVLNQRNERSLLTVQTRQAASVISATVLTLVQPLTTTLRIAQATDGDAGSFQRNMSAVTGPGKLYASAVLVEADATPEKVVATVGAAPELDLTSTQASQFIHQALTSTSFVVTGIGDTPVDRIAYALADPADPRWVVYTERVIPANRQVPAESDSAFADLHFATYLGPATTPDALATTDLPPARLPLTGMTARESIPFGNTSITLVATSARPLGGPLGAQLPWVFLLAGTLVTLLAAVPSAQLVSRRQGAEQDSATITDLYAKLDVLYSQQRSIAASLQRALLPRTNPTIPGLEIATQYVAGADGVDIGGDWYSIVVIDDRHFAFVVGDVSGRGVSAATVMARLRFTTRAYLLEGHPPDTVPQMCSRQLDINDDGHFATVLIGLVDRVTREVTLANAGHLAPLTIVGSHADYAETTVGPPLGTIPVGYEPTSFVMAPGSILLAFTDGLVERRDQPLDAGLDRLRDVATTPTENLDVLLSRLLHDMTGNRSEDDTAMLAFRWTD